MDDDSHHHDEEEEDAIIQPPLVKPRIFEGSSLKNIPEGFDAVTIYLDGRMGADLNWKKRREEAHFAVDQGYAILWDMQLGLFDKLSQPLANQAQFLSLALSLEHFRDFLWNEFRPSSLGVSLFRGTADFSQSLTWNLDQEQNFHAWLLENCSDRDEPLPLRHEIRGQQLASLFCRDVALEYLSLLANRLPDTLPVYLFLDAASLGGSLTSEMQLLNPERFDRFHLALKNPHLPFETLGWGKATPLGMSAFSPAELPEEMPASIGVCIPPASMVSRESYLGLQEALRMLQEKAIPFRLIAESKLTAQWDGLDYLIYCPFGLSKEGKRKLQGFCAAGGTVVTTGGESLGLPLEADLPSLFCHEDHEEGEESAKISK